MELQPQDAVQEWKKGRFRPAYLFFGEDDAGKLAGLEELKSHLKPDPFNVSEFPGGDDASVPELIGACNTPPMFSDRRLVVVRNLKFGAPARRELAGYLRAPMESTTLVFLSSERKIEAKDPVAAAVSALGGLTAFKPLRDGEAVSRLRAEARMGGLELSPEAAERMVEEAGTEWGILKAELEKLKLFVKGRKAVGLKDALACLGYRRETNPFAFPDCLERREQAKALGLLRRMLDDGSDPFSLLYQIIRTLNKQLKAKRMLKAGLPA